MAGKKDDKVSDDKATPQVDAIDDIQEDALDAEQTDNVDVSEDVNVDPEKQDERDDAPDETSDNVGEDEELTTTEVEDDDVVANADEQVIEDEHDLEPDASDAETTDTAQYPVPAPTPPEPEARSIWPMVFAGLVAAVLGFLAARADLIDSFLPPSMRMGADVAVANDKIDALETALTAASAKITTLEDQIANPPEVVMPEIDTTALDDAIKTLTERVDALELRPVGSGPVVQAPNFDAEFKKLADMAESQQAEIDRLLADARLVEQTSTEAANAALARAAATRIVAAVESGAPFAAALGDLAASGVDVPEALQATADSGVIQLAQLQTQFPDAARAALAAARGADTSGGLGGFLQRQLGARSVTPKEGSDPDAVLSRVEAAVREGRLNDALAEAETLPPEGQAAMAEWLENAQTRLDVTTATEALMQRLAAN